MSVSDYLDMVANKDKEAALLASDLMIRRHLLFP